MGALETFREQLHLAHQRADRRDEPIVAVPFVHTDLGAAHGHGDEHLVTGGVTARLAQQLLVGGADAIPRVLGKVRDRPGPVLIQSCRGGPFDQRTDTTAVRSFTNACNAVPHWATIQSCSIRSISPNWRPVTRIVAATIPAR